MAGLYFVLKSLLLISNSTAIADTHKGSNCRSEKILGLELTGAERDGYGKRVTGSKPVNDMNLFLAGLEKSLDLRISRNGSTALMEENPK